MILTAGTLAGGVAAAVVDALVVGFGADVVRDGKGILRGVRLLAVAADAAECQCVLNASVRVEGTLGVRWGVRAGIQDRTCY